MLATHDPPADAALAEPVDLDGRDRREIAGQQRQHARRDHRHEPREERDRQLLSHRSARAPRRPAARPRGRARAGAGARGSARVRDHTTRPEGQRDGAASAPPSGMTHASRSKPLVLGVERIVGPNSATIASRICRSVWHARDPLLHLGLHLARDLGIGLVERRVARRADEQRLEPRPGSRASCRRRREPRAQAQARPLRRASRLEREPDARFELLRRSRARDVRRHHAAAPVDEEGLGDPGHAPVAERRADAVADVRVVDAVAAADTPRAARFSVEGVDADEDDALVLPGARGVGDAACLLLARDAVRLPEVDDDDLAAQRGEAQPAVARRAAAGRASAPAPCGPGRPSARRRAPLPCATSQTSRPRRPRTAATTATRTTRIRRCGRSCRRRRGRTATRRRAPASARSRARRCSRSRPAASVPWMPTPGLEMPIQRVPSGLTGPGGTGFSPCAQESEVGGYHHGLRT